MKLLNFASNGQSYMLLKLYFITVALGMEQQILFHLMSYHNHYSWQTCLELVRYFMKTQACRNKKNSRGATNYEMSATMVADEENFSLQIV